MIGRGTVGRPRLRGATRAALLFLGAVVLTAEGCGPTPVRRELRGAPLGTAVPKPDFTFTATDGRVYDFRRETVGQLAFLFFGYTSCPDVCPVHMANLAAVLEKVSPEDRSRVRVVFITTDPARDTPAVLRAWLDHFDTSFVGLRANEEEVHRLEMSLGVPISQKESTGAKGDSAGYGVGHAAQVIAFTADDSAHVVYPFGVRQEDWAHDIPVLLRSPWMTAGSRP